MAVAVSRAGPLLAGGCAVSQPRIDSIDFSEPGSSGEVDGRGGGRGGGGRGGGGRGFRSSSRYRSRGGIRSSRRFPSGWKIAAGAGLIYGYSSYRHRSSYYRNPNRVNSLWSHLSSLWDRLDPGRVQLTTQSLLSHNNSSFQDVFYYLTSGVGGLVERSGSEGDWVSLFSSTVALSLHGPWWPAEPQICENRIDYMRPNGTNYIYFICPMANQSDSHTYCCGPSQRQHCCRFWDSGSRVAGVVVGILFGVAVVATMFYCCCCRQKGSDGKTLVQRRFTQNGLGKQPGRQPGAAIPLTGPHMGPNYPQPAAQPMGPTAEPLFPVEPNPLGPQPPYPTQHPYSSPSGYPPQSKNSSTPYPAAPGGPPYPTAAAGPPYPPAGGCPYPVGPPMSENNLPYPNTAPPQDGAPVPTPGQHFGDPAPPIYVQSAPTPYGAPASAPPIPASAAVAVVGRKPRIRAGALQQMAPPH
ncbi:hypothetical protein NP493_872g01014 [Ridgeia piscesae]|uniref:Uncharacterized protein n=1 Tax=Ridgeia piscesae TaxID=27915 RepID=A0AAD9NKK5_RIDPI|nr:hypothetical protein NP493_872g01014 [Ridgeia piscesae]